MAPSTSRPKHKGNKKAFPLRGRGRKSRKSHNMAFSMCFRRQILGFERPNGRRKTVVSTRIRVRWMRCRAHSDRSEIRSDIGRFLRKLHLIRHFVTPSSLTPGFCHRHSARHNRVSAVETLRKRYNVSFSWLPLLKEKANKRTMMDKKYTFAIRMNFPSRRWMCPPLSNSPQEVFCSAFFQKSGRGVGQRPINAQSGVISLRFFS